MYDGRSYPDQIEAIIAHRLERLAAEKGITELLARSIGKLTKDELEIISTLLVQAELRTQRTTSALANFAALEEE